MKTNMELDKESILRIHIHTQDCLELNSFAESMTALANSYEDFITKNKISYADYSEKIYISEVKKGSVIIDFILAFWKSLVIFSGDAMVVLGFIAFLNQIVKKVLTKDAVEDVSSENIRHVCKLLDLITKNENAAIEVGNIEKGKYTKRALYTRKEATKFQENAAEILKEREMPESVIYKNKALVFSRTSESTLDYGVIESISHKPRKVYYKNDALKQRMVLLEHPYKHVYIVDVIVETVDGKPMSYSVDNLVDILDKEGVR